MKNRLFLSVLILLVILLLLSPISAEKYYTGGLEVAKALRDTFPEARMPAMALVSSSLPPKVDLSSKMPPAGNQGARGSCTAFAVAYGVRTYQVGLKKRWNLNRKNHIFSPAYVFNQLSYNGRGIHIHKAMQLVINQGCSTLNLMPYNPRDYRTQPNRRARNQASLYRAMKWARLNPKDKFMVKQLLSEGNVVVAAIYCFKYFMNRRYMARKKDSNRYAWTARGCCCWLR